MDQRRSLAGPGAQQSRRPVPGTPGSARRETASPTPEAEETTAPVRDSEADSGSPGQSSLSLHRVGRVALAVVSALVLIATGVAWSQYRDLSNGLTTSDALGGAERSTGGTVNILLIGLDSRKDQDGNQLPKPILDQLHAGDGGEGGYNTNTLILLHVPADGSKVAAFSIPRDDVVDIPGEHPGKIKEAYGLAKDKADTALRNQGVTDRHTLEARSREAGRRATLGVVHNLTGVPIDHFAEVNLAGFYDLATALNGVEVCLKHPVRDSFSGANFPAGQQMLNGSQALSFVRQRHGLTNGDLDRTHRQQAFLASVTYKLRSAGTFTNPAKLQGLIDTAKRDTVIDNGWDVLTFAGQAQNLSGGNMEFHTLPIKGFGNLNGEEVNLIDPGQIRTTVQTAFGMAPPPGSPAAGAAGPAVVDVSNSSGQAGLAGTVADALARQGLTKGETSNGATRSTSTVSYGDGADADAQRVARLLGITATSADGSLPPRHIRVTLGTGFSPPRTLGAAADQHAVTAPAAAMAAPSPPSPTPNDAGPQGGAVEGGAIPCVD
jgi:LCP family protein required for cell wall assembly